MRALLSVLGLVLTTQTLAATPGLFDQPQTFPWTVGLTPVALEEAGGLEAGAVRIKSSLLWFNTYRQYGFDEKMEQQVDMEGLLPVVSAAWSPGKGWELRAQAQGWFLGGGLLDVFLSGFHGSLFLPNQGRNLVQDGSYRDYLKGRFDHRQPTSGLTQTSLGLRGFAGSWSWSGWVKPPLPAPDDWGWTDRWSGGLAAGWGDRWEWSSEWGGGLGVSAALVLAQSEPTFEGNTGGILPQIGFYTTLDTPWPFRALVQGNWTAPPARGEAYLGHGAGLLTSGIQVPLGGGWTGEVALTEEFLTWATNEVGFQFGLTWNP